jgi:hypothetical protein
MKPSYATTHPEMLRCTIIEEGWQNHALQRELATRTNGQRQKTTTYAEKLPSKYAASCVPKRPHAADKHLVHDLAPIITLTKDLGSTFG